MFILMMSNPSFPPVTIEKLRPVIDGLALVCGFALSGLVRLLWRPYAEVLVWMVWPILAVITIGALFLGIGLLLVREVRTWGCTW